MKPTILALTLFTVTCAFGANFNIDFHRKYQESQAETMLSKREYAEARQAFEELADTASDPIKAAMWRGRAAIAAGLQKDGLEQGMQMAKAIDDHPYSIQAQIALVYTARKYQELIETFGDENIAAWPQRPIPRMPRYGSESDARCLSLLDRGRAYYNTGNGDAARADLEAAAPLAHNGTRKTDIWLTLAYTYARLLDNKDKAMNAYLQVVEVGSGGADYYRGVIGAATSLRERGRYQEALDVMDHMNPYQQNGYWLGEALLAVGPILAEMGKTEEAIEAYRKIIDEDGTRDHQISAAYLAVADTLADARRTAEAIAAYNELLAYEDARNDDKERATEALEKLESSTERATQGVQK